MRPIEVFSGFLLPVVFFLLGVGLVAMGATSRAEFLAAKASFCLSAVAICIFVLWVALKHTDNIISPLSCGAIFSVIGLSLYFILGWVNNKQELALKLTPKYAGELVSKELLSPNRGFQPKNIEIGDSGTILSWTGKNGDPLFVFFSKYNLVIEEIDGKLKVSTKIGDSKGNLLAEIYRNEWKVAPPPNTFDRNYSEDALEVRDAGGSVVLQVKAMLDRIRLQGEWWDDEIHGIRLVKAQGRAGASICIFAQKMRPDQCEPIVPIFKYPSELHFGEFIDR